MPQVPHALTLDTVEQLKDALWKVQTRVEGLEHQLGRSVRPRGTKPRDRYFGQVQSGGLTARSGTTLGEGTVEIFKEVSGTLIATGRTQDIYNLAETAAAEDDYIELGRDQFDTFFANLSTGAEPPSYLVTGLSAGSVRTITTLTGGSVVGSGTSDTSLATFDSGTGKITVSQTGRYLINFAADTNIKWTTASTDQGAMVLILTTVSTGIATDAAVVTPSSSTDLALHYMSGWQIRKVTQGQTLFLQADQSNALDDGSTTYPVNNGTIGIIRLGAGH